jgi:tetratricopeptide (TPR) repeat protein
MSWKIWKAADERSREEWEKAVSLRNQGKWREAAEHFQAVSKLAEKATDQQSRNQGAIAYSLAMLYIAVEAKSSDSFLMCHNSLSRIPPQTVLEIPYKASAREIAQECMLLADEYSLPHVQLGVRVENTDAVASKMESLAQSYLALGRDSLVLGDLLKTNSNVFERSFKLLGLSRYLKGALEEYRDPDKAVQYYAEAVGYFQQAALEDYKRYLDERNRKLSSVAKCWFCGRNVQGEDIHYVYMETVLTAYMKSKIQSESPPTTKDYRIVACTVCNQAVQILADKIGRAYYEKAMKAMSEMEERLSARIASLQAQLNSVRARLASVQ